jgi:hypothetical protein
VLRREIARNLIEKKRVDRWFAGWLHLSGYATLRVDSKPTRPAYRGHGVIVLSFVSAVPFV